MPIIKAAKKDLRQSAKRKTRNLEQKKKMKEFIKKIKDLSVQGKTDKARELLSNANKAIDKAAKAGLIKANTASRKKSRISRLTKV